MKFKKIIISYDKKMRGTRESQTVFFYEQDGETPKKLYDYLIGNNNHYSNVGKHIPFDFELKMKLNEGAIVTDFLDGGFTAPYAICLSEKAYDLFNDNSFKAINFNSYPVKLYNFSGDKVLGMYHYLYPIRLIDCINFKKSIESYSPPSKIRNEADFVDIRSKIPQYLQGLDEKYPFNNPEKYNLQQRVKRWGDPEKFYVTENIFNKYDFWCFKYDVDLFISERLENAIKKAGLTGIDFQEIREQRFIYEEEKRGWFS